MHSASIGHRLSLARILLCAVLVTMMNPLTGLAQTPPPQVSFELRPHCDSTEYRAAMQSDSAPTTTPVADSTCPVFAVKDPQTKQTPVLKDGEPLDMDLIIHNPANQPINRFRAWIAYDPTVIEGELIKIASAFPTPMPGEADFSATDGYIKLSGSADKAQTASTIIVARIRLHALPMALNFTPITFYDATGKPASHTGIFTKSGDVETNLASDTSGPLLVQVASSATSSVITLPTSGSSVSAASSAVLSAVSSEVASTVSSLSSVSPAASSTAPVANVFDLLQVKHLRITTEGSSVFLAWDVLPSSELVGYNLYYGTVSGKYLQKRSIDKNSATMTIRALPIGVTYYFAVRGVNAQNTETDFSQEVGISVGKPETSTSPLTANSITPETPTPQTGGTVSGETGLPSALLLFLLLSAAIGTGLAFRRQLSAKV